MYEGFGIPIIEAMRNGCPVICSNGGALKEVGGNGLFYFDPTNEEDICNTIEKVVYSDLFTKRLIEYGLSRCDLFSWSKCAKETFEISKNKWWGGDLKGIRVLLWPLNKSQQHCVLIFNHQEDSISISIMYFHIHFHFLLKISKKYFSDFFSKSNVLIYLVIYYFPALFFKN